MAVFGVLLLLVTPLLAMLAIAVRFAGPRRVLNGVDPTDIGDLAALNRWAGNRLFLLPVTTATFGLLSLERPVLGLAGVGAAALTGLVVGLWVLIGSDRFRKPR